MATRKLTLSVDESVIRAAKTYAAERGTSVSRLVEDFLSAVATDPAPGRVTPVLTRLRGSLRGVDRQDHRDALVDKYL